MGTTDEGLSCRKVSMEDMGIMKGDILPFTLYVFLHASKKYHPIVESGSRLEGDNWSNLSRLDTANLYISEEDYKKWEEIRVKTPERALNRIEPPPFNDKILGDSAKENLQEFYQLLTTNPLTGSDRVIATETLAQMSDDVMEVLAPEAKDIKSTLLAQMRNLHVMNDMAAISSLALLAALANGFESQLALGKIAKACLVIDAGLGAIAEEDLELYYKAPSELPTHVLEKIKKHPLKSASVAEDLGLGEGLTQIILVHHELYNGAGYHRGIRTTTVSPAARIVCLAVDIFEYMRGAELRGEKVRLGQVIRELYPKESDVNKWRHSRETVFNLTKFLGMKV